MPDLRRRRTLFAPPLAALTTLFGPAAIAQATPLRGAGSTLAAPLYVAMSEQLGPRHRFELDYQAVGSGEGIQRLLNRAVDFGATERPMSRQDLENRGLVQLPTAIGAVVITANLPGVALANLRLTGELLADIYARRVTTWNHPAIAALNPGLRLPALPLLPVFREESSGTSFLFTTYLQRAGKNWTPGVTSTLAVPGGRGARGNGGVAKAVLEQAGAIGYLEYGYALENQLPTLQMRNRFGSFVAVSADTVSAAVRAADWELMYLEPRPSFDMDVVDSGCPQCWPIVGLTLIVAPTRWADPAKAAAFVRFMESVYAESDALQQQERFVPLPSRAKNLARVTLRAQLRPGQVR